MPVVTVYTTERCSRCVSAKMLLDRRGIIYEEVNLTRDPHGRSELQQRTGMMTFPQNGDRRPNARRLRRSARGGSRQPAHGIAITLSRTAAFAREQNLIGDHALGES